MWRAACSQTQVKSKREREREREREKRHSPAIGKNRQQFIVVAAPMYTFAYKASQMREGYFSRPDVDVFYTIRLKQRPFAAKMLAKAAFCSIRGHQICKSRTFKYKISPIVQYDRCCLEVCMYECMYVCQTSNVDKNPGF